MKTTYILAYDIREPKRLGRIHYFICKKATALQRSVFIFHGNQFEKQAIIDGLLKRANTTVDDIRLYPIQQLDNIWVAGQQSEKMHALYPSIPSKTIFNKKPGLIKRLFGAK